MGMFKTIVAGLLAFISSTVLAQEHGAWIGVCEISYLNQYTNAAHVHPTALGPFMTQDICLATIGTHCEGPAIDLFWKTFSHLEASLKSDIASGQALLLSVFICVPMPEDFLRNPRPIPIPDYTPHKVVDGIPRKDHPSNNFDIHPDPNPNPRVFVPVPMPPMGVPVMVPVEPGSKTHYFFMGLNKVIDKAPAVLISLIIGVLVITGIILSVEALGAAFSSGTTLALAPATISSAIAAIVALCAWYNIDISESNFRNSSTSMIEERSDDSWKVEKKDENICINGDLLSTGEEVSWCVADTK